MIRLGVHVPVGQGLVKAAQHAHAIGCEAMQIFGRNAQGWRGRTYPAAEISTFRELREQHDLAPLVLHSCYLVNLASPAKELREQSLWAVADDLARCALLDGQFVVFHFGHHKGEGTSAGIRIAATCIKVLLKELAPGITLLVENAAGRGTELGGVWEEFTQLFHEIDGDDRVGLCFDTCHAHAAGYRLDTPQQVGRTLRAVDAAIGLDRLRLMHLNDGLGEAGSHVDHHQHLGRGTIGEAGFRALLHRKELQRLAALLETPVDRPGDDRRNLRKAKELRGG